MIDAVLANARRLRGWLISSAVAAALIAFVAPQQLPVLVFKVAQVTIAIMLAYGADRSLFFNAPGLVADMPRDLLSAARILARAILALAVVLGLTLGI